MTYVRDNSYCVIPFSDETPQGEFYSYFNLRNIFIKCEGSKEHSFKCRTIGILKSVYGRFYLHDINTINNSESSMIQVSVVYLKSPLQSTVIPYSVQIFGTVQWRKRPVLFAKLLQVISTSMAVRLSETMDAVSSTHLARSLNNNTNNVDVQPT